MSFKRKVTKSLCEPPSLTSLLNETEKVTEGPSASFIQSLTMGVRKKEKKSVVGLQPPIKSVKNALHFKLEPKEVKKTSFDRTESTKSKRNDQVSCASMAFYLPVALSLETGGA